MIFTEDELARVDKVLKGAINLDENSVKESQELGAELTAKYGQELKLQGITEAQEYFKDAHAEYKKQQDVAKWIKKNSKIH